MMWTGFALISIVCWDSLVVSAVVFAYHDIGVRCLEALLELGIAIRLVVSHQDNPSEKIWFGSVEKTAKAHDIPVITPENPNVPEVIKRIIRCEPDFIFSFYYRNMLATEILEIPRMGAFNVHGSLLPKYRGRVPVNWAIIHGENECGVSLHRMVHQPDAGNLVAQRSVPILINDTAHDVFQKLTGVAQAMILDAVPRMIAGTITETPLKLENGSYFSGRRPEDGEIDWNQPARRIHDLIRAVAPPYPGAFFYRGINRIEILGSHYCGDRNRFSDPGIYFENGNFWADCCDGYRFMITDLKIDQVKADFKIFSQVFGERLTLKSITHKVEAASNE
jgi:methionyl-tRNA formyltransferase